MKKISKSIWAITFLCLGKFSIVPVKSYSQTIELFQNTCACLEEKSNGHQFYLAFNPERADGNYKVYYGLNNNDSLFAELTVKDSALIGLYKEYTPDGKLRFTQYYTLNGLKNGEFTSYYFNGSISEKSNWKMDKREGEFIQYFPNGTYNILTRFENGLEQGNYYEWDKDGQLIAFGFFRDGIPEGMFIRRFGKNNKYMNIEIYQNGKRIFNSTIRSNDELFVNIANM